MDSTDFDMLDYSSDKIQINGKTINVRGGKTYKFTVQGKDHFIS